MISGDWKGSLIVIVTSDGVLGVASFSLSLSKTFTATEPFGESIVLKSFNIYMFIYNIK